jgi:hypothetical protein
MHGRDARSDAFNPERGLEWVEAGVARRRTVTEGRNGAKCSANGFFEISPRGHVSQNQFAEARTIIHLSHTAKKEPTWQRREFVENPVVRSDTRGSGDSDKAWPARPHLVVLSVVLVVG